MIAKSYIETTLRELNYLFNNSTSQKKNIYFAKLAIIELCGWIEETLDDIIKSHSHRNLKEAANKKYCRDKIIKPNYGFQYNENIRPMLISLIGLIEMEKIEKKLEKTATITLLKTTLGNLKQVRNEVAHTYLKGITKTYNAPSRTIADFRTILSALEKIDLELRS